MNHPVLTFNAGEVSPYLRHRIDFEKTPASCESLVNFLCLPYGAIVKRPGLKTLAAVEDAGENSRLLPFVASTGDRYLLHFTPDLLTILRADGTVADTLAFLDGHTWPEDWDENLRAIQAVQLNDIAFIVHPATHPMRLSRVADTNWTLEAIPFTVPPLREPNADDDMTVDVVSATSPPAAWSGASGYTAGDHVTYNSKEWTCCLTHTANASLIPGTVTGDPYWQSRIFPAGHVVSVPMTGGTFPTLPVEGLAMRATMFPVGSDTSIKLAAITSNNAVISPIIPVDGRWTFATYGTVKGAYTLIRYTPTDSGYRDAVVLRKWTVEGDRSISESGIEDAPCGMAIRFEQSTGTPATGEQGGFLTADSNRYAGDLLITALDEAGETATATCVSPVMSGNTYHFAFAAFSSATGYPRAIALHDSRLVFAGTTSQPVTLWFSQTNDFLDFETGPDDDAAVVATLALTNASPIRWLASQRRLFVGTALGEWVVGSESSDSPISPSTFMARQWASYGTAPVAPLIANDAVFFAERKGTRLRELSYFADREGYDAADLTRLAEHLTRPGIAEMAWQQTREQGLWLVRRDGVLLHFAYARAERVAAWSRHTTAGGTFRNAAVLPSDAGDDEVFFIVDRGTASYLERFPQHWMEAQETNNGWFHLDGVAGTGTGAAVTLPDHLKNTPVTRLNPATLAVTTAAYAANPTIPNGTPYQIGHAIPAALVSLPIDFAGDSTLAKRKRLHRVSLSLFMSRGGTISNVSDARAQAIPNTRPADVLRSGWEDCVPDAGHRDEIQLRLHHADPFPFTLRAACLRFQLTEHG